MSLETTKETNLKTVTLHCVLGDHEWERPSQRGRRPVNCSLHQPVEDEKPAKSEQTISSARVKVIENVLANRGNCTCAIETTMKDEDLMKESLSCTDSHVCSTLDRIRRLVVDYGRHLREMDGEDTSDE